MTEREEYCEQLLDRLVDACRDAVFPGESVSARKNVHDNAKKSAVLICSSYRKFLMKYGRRWARKTLAEDFASPEHLDLILTSRGY